MNWLRRRRIEGHTSRDSWRRIAHLFCGRHLREPQGREVPRFRHRYPEDELEAHHRLAREGLGIRSSDIPINPRGHDGTPAGKYRGQMARRFRPKPEGSRSKRVYGQRWAVESAFSRHKRVLGSALGGKSDASWQREGYLRVLTHNLMLLAAVK